MPVPGDPRLARTRVAAALVLTMTIAYAVLAFRILSPDVLYSIDTAVKFVQARSLLSHHMIAMPLENRVAYIDPDGEFTPFRSPFVFRSDEGLQAIFPTAGAVLLAPWSALGLAGLAWPAVLSAGLLLAVTTRFARGSPLSAAIPVVLGAATMLWFYAVIPNEHGLAATLTTAALVLVMQPGASVARLAVAGLLMGLAAAFRDEALLIVPGAAAARWIVGTRGRALARDASILAVTVVAVLAGVALVDVLVYHRPAAAHLLHAVSPLREYVDADSSLPSIPVMSWAQRYETLVNYWLLGAADSRMGWLFLAALAAAFAVRWRTGSAALLIVVMGSLTVVSAGGMWSVISAPKFVAGLFRLCPYLVFALLPLPPGRSSSAARRVALVASFLYVAVAFLNLSTSGGKSLGPRLLLPVVPLLVVAALESIVVWAAEWPRRKLDGLVGALGAGLVVCAVCLELGGPIRAYVDRNESDGVTVRALQASSSEHIVLDNPFTLQLVASLYFDRTIMLATDQGTASALATRLLAARVMSFDVLSRNDPPRLTFAPYSMVQQQQTGRLVRQVWRR